MKSRISRWVSMVLGNWVDAAGMPGPATANPTGRKPAATQQTIAAESFVRVFRATRMEAAGSRQDRPQEPLVCPYRTPQAGRDHLRFRAANSARSCEIIFVLALVPYGGRTSTSSGPSVSCSRRNASLMHRLMRFRSVAAAACLRLTRTPSLGGPASRLAR